METLSEVRASLELGILVSTVLQNPGDKWWGPRGGWDVVFSLVVMPGVALGAERKASSATKSVPFIENSWEKPVYFFFYRLCEALKYTSILSNSCFK